MKDFPIHPSLVHFPIAFYFLEFLLIFLWVAKNQENYYAFSRFSFHTAYVAMWLALATGLYTVGSLASAWKHTRAHFLAALSVMVFYTFRFFFWHSPWKGSKKGQLLQAAFGTALVFLTGYFGGVLAHGH